MIDETEQSKPATETDLALEGPAAETSNRHITFTADNAFQLELRSRVDEYFQRTGRRRRDSNQLYVKAPVFLLTWAVSYLFLVFVAEAWWQAVPVAIFLGLATAGIGFNLMHDGAHGAFSRYPFINRMMARSLDVVGGSSYFWHWKHDIFHHSYTNITGVDTDITLGKLARMTPHQPRYALHRWQHWYLWMLYGGMPVKWHFYDDFRDLLMGGFGPQKIPRPKNKDLAVFAGGKVIFFTLAFGVPLLFHSWWVIAIFYGLVTVVMGVVLSIVFQLAHCVEEAAFPVPDESTGKVDNPWAVHQVQTTVDFCRENRAVAWLLGGLNFQIEHHLFPRISHSNYPAISALVKETCLDFGIPYHEHPSFWAGILSHFRWLRKMGCEPQQAVAVSP